MMNQLDPDPKTFGDWAYVALAKHSKKIFKHESNVLSDIDPEDLHQMRVGMRRLRSAIAGFAPALDLPKEASEKKVGNIARILGELRDIDVLGDALKTQYQPILPKKEQKSLEEALKVLAKRRNKAFEEVQKILTDGRYLELKSNLQNWLKNPSYQEVGRISIDNVLPDLLLPQMSHLLLHPGWLVGVKVEDGEAKPSSEWDKDQVEHLLETQGVTLHELRKESKRSRYNMELFTQFYDDVYLAYLKDIKDIQTVLGDIQDCFVLANFLAEVFGKEAHKVMPSLSDNLQNTRYQKWQEWLILQSKFLNPTLRTELRLTILQPSLIKSKLEMAVNSED